MSRKAFIFFGPPGAGKGTISRRCVEELGWIQLSTGDLFRKHIQEETSLGKMIAQAISQGTLVDDSIVIDVVCEWMMQHKENQKPLIFDGFPRTLKQAGLFLDKIKTFMLCEVIVLEIDDQEVIDRLLSRRTCTNYNCQKAYSSKEYVGNTCKLCGSALYQRPDDTLETIQNRLNVYHVHADPLLDFYKNQGLGIKKINASQPVENVFHDLLIATGEIL